LETLESSLVLLKSQGKNWAIHLWMRGMHEQVSFQKGRCPLRDTGLDEIAKLLGRVDGPAG
jgi:hypothetical protein